LDLTSIPLTPYTLPPSYTLLTLTMKNFMPMSRLMTQCTVWGVCSLAITSTPLTPTPHLSPYTLLTLTIKNFMPMSRLMTQCTVWGVGSLAITSTPLTPYTPSLPLHPPHLDPKELHAHEQANDTVYSVGCLFFGP